MNADGPPGRAVTAARTALVTGAGRGIGAAVARRLAAQGMRIVALDRCSDDPGVEYPMATREELDAVVADCGNGSRAVVADVGDRAGLASALGELLGEREDHRAGIDTVVCAAGVVWGGGPVWSTPPEVWEALVRTNTSGVLNTAAAVVPRMLPAPGTGRSPGDVPRSRGRFVVVASAAADRGLPMMGAYAATKAAAVSIVRSMAADLGPSGITVNAVSPGSTDTRILAASADVYGLGSPQEFAVHHTTQRLVGADEVASAVAWLCSDEASAVTGAVLAVDGGMTAT